MDGYVRANITATPNTSTQTVSTNDYIDVRFAYKITGITTESVGASITSATTVEVGDNTGVNPCTLSAGAWYCPVVLANSDGTMIMHFAKDGYVEKSNYALVTGTTRTTNATAQRTDTVSGIQYAVKATVVDQANGAVTGATVQAGNDYGTTCVESGSTGVYYCPVPLADTYFTVRAAKTGYSTGLQNHTDRTAATDAQQAVSISLNSATVSSSSGGGGIGSSGGATGYASTSTSTETSTNTSNSGTTTSTETSGSTSGSSLPEKTVAQMILEEKDMLAAKNASGIAYFNASGTPSTMKIGAGERAAAVSSFKEAYGKDPVTAADWQDVLNIANGRWPLAVNKAVEARAYVNFRAVYGRNADMKNSGDVNTLKMMGYGVRSTMPRDLKAEASAIVRFKATFGFAPTTARHWNVVRAIAYGVKK